ncbi:MAG: DUF4159 domain-containing protein [Candidatus Nitrohelix vancouverensis]|uniref:DUF4159 domain-containing protein n=1 Tax=Candidatus Nitrohelix vancouverensis TaxID=2705534 RepID=A0A7T0C576_9BACT|nr:MAG: DUF4159 domain-containing protein [Candidatus Nitrohelix vancouverensis]
MYLILTFLISIASLAAPDRAFSAQGPDSRFTLPLVKYQGGDYKPREGALDGLLAQIARRTSIEVNREPVEIGLSDSTLYQYPFLYLGGDKAFTMPSEKELQNLRYFLNYGGFLLIDDNSGNENSAFDKSARALVGRLFPQTPLSEIDRDHSIFRSFYLINRVVGRHFIKPYLEGVSIKGRTALIYSSNDLGGAWARNKLGGWNYDMISGGSVQRQHSIRLGINIVMYALTLDYKKDMVHLPIILERLRRFNAQ